MFKDPSLPYLGQRVLFYDPYSIQTPGGRTPRIAFVSGLGERPGVVHLTVFNHPDDDVHGQGMAPVQARRRVEFIPRDRPRPGPTVCYCEPADELVSFKTLVLHEPVAEPIPPAEPERLTISQIRAELTERTARPRTRRLSAKFTAADKATPPAGPITRARGKRA